MFQTEIAEKMEPPPRRPENDAFYEIMWENMVEPERPQMEIQCSACALHAGYLRLQTHAQNMQYALLFHCKNGYANAPQC